MNRNKETKKKITRSSAAFFAALLFFTAMIFMTGCQQTKEDPEERMPSSEAESARELSPEPESLTKVSQQPREILIDCLGDSITWGMYSTPELSDAVHSGEIETGPDDGGQLFEDVGIYVSGVYQSKPSYPEVMEEELNRKFSEAEIPIHVTAVNDGICGDWITSESYLRMSCDPDLVILFLAGNNYYNGIPVDGLLEENIQNLRALGKTVYLANYPLHPAGSLEPVFEMANVKLGEVSQTENVPMIDFYTAFEEALAAGEFERDEMFSPDLVHLSEKGYAFLGRVASEFLFEELSK